MANNAYPFVGNTGQQSSQFEIEIIGGDQKKRLAEMLRGNMLNQPQGQMIGNWYVAPSWAQQLAPALGGVLGTYLGKEAEQDEQKLLQKDLDLLYGKTAPQRMAQALRPTQEPTTTPLPEGDVTPEAQVNPVGMALPQGRGGVEVSPQVNLQQPQGMPDYRQFQSPQIRNMMLKKHIESLTPEYSTTPQYDQSGRAFVLDKAGNMKYLGGEQSPVRKADYNELIYIDPTTGKPTINPLALQAKSLVAQQGAPRQMVAVNTQLPFKEQVQKGMGEALVKNYETLQNIPSAIQSLDRASELAPKSYAGSMAEQKLEAVKFLNNNLGLNITPDKVANTEELRAALFTNVMENLKKLDASPSQQQQQILQQSMGNIGTDPKAIPRIVNTYKEILTSKAKEHNRRVEESMQGPNGMVYPYSIKVNLPEKSPVKAGGKVKFLGFE